MLNNSAVPYAVDFGRTVLKQNVKSKKKDDQWDSQCKNISNALINS